MTETSSEPSFVSDTQSPFTALYLSTSWSPQPGYFFSANKITCNKNGLSLEGDGGSGGA